MDAVSRGSVSGGISARGDMAGCVCALRRRSRVDWVAREERMAAVCRFRSAFNDETVLDMD